jgi:2-polyprenyl-6-hydroxyphenyl methylase/3-demethylubiquinone-9 3-methyltransferase
MHKDQAEAAVIAKKISDGWDHSSREEFVKYYAEKSTRPAQLQHFRSVRNTILRVLNLRNAPGRKYDVLDVGCNVGGQCLDWAEDGHRVHGLDISEPLLELAKKRAAESGFSIDYRLGSATDLPWADESMDVCIAAELLEHVVDWEVCLQVFARVLRPGGVLFLTTSNALCPVQYEFNLPLYSWYPRRLKRRYERLAVTTRPELANYVKYPAVNWFSAYSLGAELSRQGFRTMDRFDLFDTADKTKATGFVITCIRKLPPLRFLAHVCTSGTIVLGIKE